MEYKRFVDDNRWGDSAKHWGTVGLGISRGDIATRLQGRKPTANGTVGDFLVVLIHGGFPTQIEGYKIRCGIRWSLVVSR